MQSLLKPFAGSYNIPVNGWEISLRDRGMPLLEIDAIVTLAGSYDTRRHCKKMG